MSTTGEKCPYCLVTFTASWGSFGLGPDSQFTDWIVCHARCPACGRLLLSLGRSNGQPTSFELIYPRVPSRPPLSPEIPEEYSCDYREACMVLADSPKASAALARRCLQAALRDKGGFTQHDLSKQIDAAISSNFLPNYIIEGLDAIRQVGNFAAHPLKDQQTGEIVDVEPYEAEWTLDTLEQLLRFYFELPALAQAKRDALNAKLQSIGKPPLK